MQSSYLMAIVADQQQRQSLADADAYRQAQATEPEASSRPERPTRPPRRRLARLIFAH